MYAISRHKRKANGAAVTTDESCNQSCNRIFKSHVQSHEELQEVEIDLINFVYELYIENFILRLLIYLILCAYVLYSLSTLKRAYILDTKKRFSGLFVEIQYILWSALFQWIVTLRHLKIF